YYIYIGENIPDLGEIGRGERMGVVDQVNIPALGEIGRGDRVFVAAQVNIPALGEIGRGERVFVAAQVNIPALGEIGRGERVFVAAQVNITTLSQPCYVLWRAVSCYQCAFVDHAVTSLVNGAHNYLQQSGLRVPLAVVQRVI